MKIKPAPLQPDSIPFRLPGVMVRATRWGWIVQRNPRKEGRAWSQEVRDMRTRFSFAARMASNPNPLDLATAHFFSQGTEQVPRDILTTAALGRYFELVNPDGTVWGHVEGATFQDPATPDPAPPLLGYDLWFDALRTGMASLGEITSWADSSPSGTNLALLTATGPILTDAISPTGRPAAVFNGTQAMRVDFANRPAPCTRFWVTSNTGTLNQTVFDTWSGSPRWRYDNAFAGNPTILLDAGTFSFAFGSTPQPLAVRAQRQAGVNSRTTINGTQVSTASVGTNGRKGFVMGARNNNTNRMSGAICEILDYPMALSNADMDAVNAYLMAKWITP